jgi:hypothetical protein
MCKLAQVGRTKDALRMSDEGAGGIFVNSAGALARTCSACL